MQHHFPDFIHLSLHLSLSSSNAPDSLEMIFEELRQESTALEASCRRHNGFSAYKGPEVALDGCGEKISKNSRRRKMELRRVKPVTIGKSEDLVVFSKLNGSVRNSSDAKEDINLMEEALPENDVLRSGGVTCPSYGAVSIIGRRREMEDEVAAELGFLRKGGRYYDFYGVYDGHGGWRVSRACREMLHKLVAEIAGADAGEGEEIAWERVMTDGFRKMDEEVIKNGGTEVASTGSTAVVAVVGKEEVVVANCGDSRAVLSRGGVAVQLSDDHKPDRVDELKRIEGCGGKVINWNGNRVLGVLATSRSIGDHCLKPFVIADPEVKSIRRTKSDEFLILASDGLWDVISNDVACQVARRCLEGRMKRSENRGGGRTAQAAALLAKLAMARGSYDNISIVVVDLRNNSCC